MRVACGVVTFNRVALLRRAVEATLAQSRLPDRIFIINNASTDGTSEYLATLDHPVITVVNLAKNLGGAGGFAMILALAAEQGFDAAWVFDDDGVPDPAELYELEAGMERHQLDLAGSLVIAEDDEELLAFGLISERRGAKRPPLMTVAAAQEGAVDGLLADMANPFNGVMLRLATIGRSGNIRSEMFLWGDEIELLRRLIREGYRVGTILKARHHHPRPKTPYAATPFGLARTPPPGRELYFYRNLAYNFAQHHGTIQSMLKMARSMAQQAYFGRLLHALKIPMWWSDGLFDLYWLAPTRSELKSAWDTEKQRVGSYI